MKYLILIFLSLGCTKSFEPKYSVGECFNIAPPSFLNHMGIHPQAFYKITSIDKEASLPYHVSSNISSDPKSKSFSEATLNLFQKTSCRQNLNLKYDVGDCFDAVSSKTDSIAQQRELIFQIVNKKPKEYHPYEFITYSNKEKAVVKQAGINTFNDTLFDKFKKIDCPKEITRSK